MNLLILVSAVALVLLILLLYQLYAKDRIQRRLTHSQVCLERMAKEYDDLFAQAPLGIFRTTPGGKLLMANPEVASILGYASIEEMKSKVMDVGQDMYANAMAREKVNRIFENGGRLTQFEAQFKRADGSITWVYINAAATYDEQGRPIRYNGFLSDYSVQRKKSESLRAYARELAREVQSRNLDLQSAYDSLLKTNCQLQEAKAAAEMANKAKGEFLANMSHEIRTPLNAVIALSEVVLETELNNRQREYIEIMRSSSKSLLRVINDILDFSKIEADKLDLEHIEFKPRELLDDVADMYRDKVAATAVELVIDVSRDTPEVLAGDPYRLRQVLINLVSNAFKFTHTGEVYIGLHVHRETTTRIKAVFTIKDTGIGMPQDVIENLFVPFSQADGSTSRMYGGTGLGLAISKKLIGYFGGDIDVSSEVGSGTTFTFTAWFEKRHADKSMALRVPDDIAQKRAIIIEDSPGSRLVLMNLLLSLGMQAEAFEHAEQALEALESSRVEPPGFLFLDQRLPGMFGLDFIEEANRRGMYIPPTVLMTAYNDEKEFDRAEALGIRSILIKPLTRSRLYQCILDAVGARPSRRKRPGQHRALPQPGSRILLVEDNPTNRLVAREVLEGAHLVVEDAEHGRAALEAVSQATYDVILMDIQMPGMDGFEATTRLRTLPELENTPIIAMTAHAMMGDRERCLAAGMDDYIAKPIDQTEMLAILARHIPTKQGDWSPAAHMQSAAQKEHNMAAQTSLSQQLDSDRLEELEGIDLDEAMERLGGKRELYKTILLRYREDFRNLIGEITQAVESRDETKAMQLAHRFGGASGNISARLARKAALDFQAALKTGDDGTIHRAVQQLTENTTSLFSSIDMLSHNER
ncbi:PAS domain-containing hybrid sensor histidine kinase/response regulator [Desulfovibrio inopinatus]|uniref:PAS domain-containing hybrid sensor histidine kinase/response regulator n=1 Tax=Desulfovibrio inopinatus TaxID=102109 RepID=UPI0003FD651F|nr:PAS domain-containing hybrid sensor histidine kinase/response regulator [Desulfovibrio inopinatus]